MFTRLRKYIAIDTKSDENCAECPSSSGQLKLGKLLLEELREMGLEAHQDEHGYVYGKLKSNTDKKTKTIGLVAHLDTAPDLDGEVKNPQVLKYKDGDVRLNDQYSITQKEFPFLKNLKNQTIMTTDGTTLLGSDDKSGITIIMEVLDYLLKHPEVEHGNIHVAFTPDEEIGRGTDFFDVKGFDADFAYTVDGGALGEIEYENFNAATLHLTFEGKNIHPGSAKNTLINAMQLAIDFHQMLPVQARPEYTNNYEGFFMIRSFDGEIEQTKTEYILRDHSMSAFESKKQLAREIVALLEHKYQTKISLDIKDSYYNMKEKIEDHFYLIDMAKEAMVELGIEPIVKPIRGGTDGAQLSYKGLPCPNLFTGGYNFHGRYELVSLEQMKKSRDVILKIIGKVLELDTDKK